MSSVAALGSSTDVSTGKIYIPLTLATLFFDTQKKEKKCKSCMLPFNLLNVWRGAQMIMHLGAFDLAGIIAFSGKTTLAYLFADLETPVDLATILKFHTSEHSFVHASEYISEKKKQLN